VSTSSPVTIWLSTSVAGFLSFGVITALPAVTHVVPDSTIDTVAKGVARSKKALTITVWPACTGRSMPSLQASAPGAMVRLLRPPK